MKVFKGQSGTTVLEFHKTYGSFVDFNEKVQQIREKLDEIESELLEADE